MSPTFSIIIPVYNVAPYLRECLDSVLAQTYDDWEAVCVDDGSTDGSGAILDEYATKDGRLRVVHQKNAGVSAARNEALTIAHGEWFLFLDGDDRFREDALEQLLACGTDDETDCVLITPYIPYWDGGKVPLRKLETKALINNASKEDLVLGPYAANGFVISRVYRRSVFGDLRFRLDMKMAEDVCFWFDALQREGRWAIVQAEYYLYRQRPDSACGRKDPHDCVAILESELHAFRGIDNGALLVKDAKRKYHNRFPWSPRDYLNIATAKAEVLTPSEWAAIHEKWSAIEKQIGCWPYDMRLWLKLLIAPHVGLRPILRVIDALWYCKRMIGDVFRFLHLREMHVATK